MLSLFKKSLVLRLITAISLLFVIGLGTLVYLQSHAARESSLSLFKTNHIEKSELLVTQMRGGLKWKKKDGIDSVYADLKDAPATTLAAVIATDADGKIITEYARGTAQLESYKKSFDTLKNETTQKDITTHEESGTLLTFKKVTDPKDGAVLGYVTIIWDKSSIVEKLREDVNSQIVISALFVAGALIVLFLLVKTIIQNPLKKVQSSVMELSQNNTNNDIPYVERHDEFGNISRALVIFRDNILETQRLRNEQKLQEDRARADRIKALNDMADNFEKQIGGFIAGLIHAGKEMEKTSNALVDNANNTSGSASSASESAQDASRNVTSVAYATEQLNASIQEISRQVDHSNRHATEAQSRANDTSVKMQELVAASERIGEVVDLIKAIAEQTNLLALNATIEAARAGDAGKGFAVVANEVKSLAAQTGKATEEISMQVDGIQQATQNSNTSLKEIVTVINLIQEITSTIASAVEEQGAASREISNSVQKAAEGTQSVTHNVSDVAHLAESTRSMSEAVLVSTQDMSMQTGNLENAVKDFLNSVRS